MPTADSSVKWDTIYSIPAKQRGSFWVWLNATENNRYLLVEDGMKSDELNCVDGFECYLYEKWSSQLWKNQVILPSNRYDGQSYTVFDCDKEDKNNEGIQTVKANLIAFMLHPYRHDKFELSSGKVVDWYNFEKELLQAHKMLLKNPSSVKLFFSLQGCARELTNMILGTYYGYTNSFK